MMTVVRPEKVWWTATEIAAARLPDVPGTRQGVEAEAKRSGWRDHPEWSRQRSGRGGAAADCHKFDVFTRWEDGHIDRCQIVAFQDIYSNKILSWRIDHTPNEAAVMAAFGEMVETWGIPEHCTFDNGREFAAKWLSGGVKTLPRNPMATDTYTIKRDVTSGCAVYDVQLFALRCQVERTPRPTFASARKRKIGRQRRRSGPPAVKSFPDPCHRTQHDQRTGKDVDSFWNDPILFGTFLMGGWESWVRPASASQSSYPCPAKCRIPWPVYCATRPMEFFYEQGCWRC